MLKTIIRIAVFYLVAGILTTIALSQTPYSDNSWISTTLLWPLFLYALVAG